MGVWMGWDIASETEDVLVHHMPGLKNGCISPKAGGTGKLRGFLLRILAQSQGAPNPSRS